MTKIVPFSGAFAWAGTKNDFYYKYVKLQDKPVTAKQYDKALAEWKKKRKI